MNQQFDLAGSPVFIGSSALEMFHERLEKSLIAERIFILCDENTKSKCLPILVSVLRNRYTIILIEISSGEQNKNIHTCIDIWSQLNASGADKNDILINLGGGVVSDIGGFVAATYKRGIDFINIPTSLMGMTDAAIGGKTGVDLQHIKNCIGVIDFPVATFIYPDFLKTLDDRNISNGLAEIYKHALIADKVLWDKFPDFIPERNSIAAFINDSLSVKIKIVAQDPYEKGIRKILNFGHTIGHSLESCFLEKHGGDFLHGEAIIAGMIMEVKLSEKYANLNNDVADHIIQKLISVFGIQDFSSISATELIAYMRHDKKNQQHEFRFSLLRSIGDAVWDVNVSEEDVLEVFSQFQSINADL
jgi:3-dehydroquinate synthase